MLCIHNTMSLGNALSSLVIFPLQPWHLVTLFPHTRQTWGGLSIGVTPLNDLGTVNSPSSTPNTSKATFSFSLIQALNGGVCPPLPHPLPWPLCTGHQLHCTGPWLPHLLMCPHPCVPLKLSLDVVSEVGDNCCNAGGVWTHTGDDGCGCGGK